MRIVHHLVLGLILTFSLSAGGLTAGGAEPDPAANVNVGILRTAGPDGCRWTFAVSGNTAVLDPAGQTCRVADEVVEVASLTMACDSRRQASNLCTNRQHDGVTSTHVLTGRALTRR